MNTTATTTGRALDAPALNGRPQTLAEIVDHEALGYRAWGTQAGDFLAHQMERLAQLIRWTSASNPVDFEDRMETSERELRDRLYQTGFADGFESGRRECRCGLANVDRD